MNEDTLKGKAKDVAGRVERQVGEWTGDEEHQVKGMAKQAEGKVQNALGKAKDAVKDTISGARDDDDEARRRENEEVRENEERRRSA